MRKKRNTEGKRNPNYKLRLDKTHSPKKDEYREQERWKEEKERGDKRNEWKRG